MSGASKKLLLGAATLLLLCVVLVTLNKERWTSPADELRTLLGYYRYIEIQEARHYEERRQYATSLGELSTTYSSARSPFRSVARCQDGYCFDLSANNSGYVIRIIPDRSSTKQRRRWSLYSDEARVVHVSFGYPLADAKSKPLSQAEIERFGGH